MLRPPFVTAVVAALLAFAACGDGNDDTPTPTLAPLPTQAASPTAAATATAARTPTAAASPTPLASPSPLPADVAEARTQLIAAATAELKARFVSPLSREACIENNPSQQLCFDLVSKPDSYVRGIAQLAGGDPSGGGVTLFMARDASNQWKFWFGTQQTVPVLAALPGDMIACGGGQGITVRAQPSDTAEQVAKLQELAPMRAQQFVLTAAGSLTPGAPRGEGWYRISLPANGWVNARDITDAAQKNCTLHDAIQGASPRG